MTIADPQNRPHATFDPIDAVAMVEWWNQKPAIEAALAVASANRAAVAGDPVAKALALARAYFADDDPDTPAAAMRPTRAQVRAALDAALAP